MIILYACILQTPLGDLESLRFRVFVLSSWKKWNEKNIAALITRAEDFEEKCECKSECDGRRKRSRVTQNVSIFFACAWTRIFFRKVIFY